MRSVSSTRNIQCKVTVVASSIDRESAVSDNNRICFKHTWSALGARNTCDSSVTYGSRWGLEDRVDLCRLGDLALLSYLSSQMNYSEILVYDLVWKWTLSQHEDDLMIMLYQADSFIRIRPPGSDPQDPTPRIRPPGSDPQDPTPRIRPPGYDPQDPTPRIPPPGSHPQDPTPRIRPPGSDPQDPTPRIRPPGSDPQDYIYSKEKSFNILLLRVIKFCLTCNNNNNNNNLIFIHTLFNITNSQGVSHVIFTNFLHAHPISYDTTSSTPRPSHDNILWLCRNSVKI